MRRQGLRRRVAAWLAVGTLALSMLGGCAAQTPVPHAAVQSAELAVARAHSAGAERDAPAELARAEEALEAAHAAIRARDHGRARTLVEQALVDAELAEAEARAAQVRAVASQLRQQVEQRHRGIVPGSNGG